MAKIVLVSSKDNNFYNFRSELVLRLVEMGYDVVLVCPPGEKIKFFTERGCRFVGHNIDRRGTSAFNDLKLIYDYFRIFRRENLMLFWHIQVKALFMVVLFVAA